MRKIISLAALLPLLVFLGAAIAPKSIPSPKPSAIADVKNSTPSIKVIHVKKRDNAEYVVSNYSSGSAQITGISYAASNGNYVPLTGNTFPVLSSVYSKSFTGTIGTFDVKVDYYCDPSTTSVTYEIWLASMGGSYADSWGYVASGSHVFYNVPVTATIYVWVEDAH